MHSLVAPSLILSEKSIRVRLFFYFFFSVILWSRLLSLLFLSLSSFPRPSVLLSSCLLILTTQSNRFGRISVSLRSILQGRRPRSRSSQRLYRISQDCGCQDPDCPHRTSNVSMNMNSPEISEIPDIRISIHLWDNPH